MLILSLIAIPIRIPDPESGAMREMRDSVGILDGD